VSLQIEEEKDAAPWKPGCPEIFIKKWCDYSSKYGLAYLLSDNSLGVSFNDGSRMFAFPQAAVFAYEEKAKFSDGQWRN
jgi:hypothetical protein